jgi:hypothetical protein
VTAELVQHFHFQGEFISARGYKEMSSIFAVNAGEGGSCGVSANKYCCAHHVTWSPNKLGDLPPYLTYGFGYITRLPQSGGGYCTRSNDYYLTSLRLVGGGGGVQHPVGNIHECEGEGSISCWQFCVGGGPPTDIAEGDGSQGNYNH